MQTGLDRVAAGFEPGLEGKRIALLCNHTALDNWGRHAVQSLTSVPGLTVVRLLAPEHGIWGTHQDMEAVNSTSALDGSAATDPVFGLPVVSLYGSDEGSLHARPEALAGVDAVVYDIQDIGTRYYTYAATLAFTMEAAAAAGVPVWVLDRPNPIGPDREGPLLQRGFESFVGIEAGLPIRHGMTTGQLAMWYGKRRAPGCDLRVVACDRHASLAWVPPSPNMPSLDTAYVYPGMCLIEGTTLSEGRGTTTPFQLVGAPGVDPLALQSALVRFECPGVDFVPRIFRPEFGKHAGEACGGVYIRVFDRTCLRGVRIGAFVLSAMASVAPDAWTWRADPYEFVSDRPAIDLLWGSTALREAIDAGEDVEPLLGAGSREAAAFDPAD